ncbi:hypothetical protein EYC80_009867 [Monilinia laxa]|uniref:Extracellular membrane protein CFEM domain-containing protein n=1 Tax=Monilinia laxa TaxID=61186 RepID=A0A5N6JRK5_MONLA|nr:hypothetical protein EYC80_009867 [Monilinia laxa]
MRAFVPTLINLGLVTLAVAQSSSSNSTSCVSSYQSCLDNGGADNTCQSENAKCKNTCADAYGSCLRSSDDSSACINTYNSCLNSYTIFTTVANSAGKDCASLFSGCHDAGKPDNTCNSIAAQCKDKCSTIYATALTSGSADTSAASTQYNNCLDSFSVFSTRESSASIDCVSHFSTCRANGTDDNTCNSYNAQCKDKCSAIYGICLSSGSADDSQCMNQYNNCLDSFTPSTSLDCVSSFTSCRNQGGAANECASLSATCKNDASISYSTCLSSGDKDLEAPCLQQYNLALVQFNTPALKNNTDCVSKFTKCQNDGTADSLCQSENADCKTDCSTSYSTCLSSGDPSLAAPCLEQYNFCLVTFAWSTNTTTTGQDCVSKYLSAKGDDNERNAVAATCKSACSTSYSTCLSSGDESLEAPCLNQYNLCLVDFKSTTTTTDCASSYLSCDEAENTCAAGVASCKNTCSVALDISQSSGDPALIALSQKRYQSCLASFTAATAAIRQDCVGAFTSCRAAGGADNTCSSDMASCKNKCSSVYDIFNTSGDNTTAFDVFNTSGDNTTIAASQALRLYDNCLVSFTVNETTPAGQDCASKYYACDLAGVLAKNECNSEYATCKNDCAVVLDACKSSGDVSLLSMCDSMYNKCLDPVMNSNITSNTTVQINATSTYIMPTNTAYFNLTGAYSTIVSQASSYVSGTPAASTNGTGHYVPSSTSLAPSAHVSTIVSSGASLPVITASASYVYPNATSASASITPTTTEPLIAIDTIAPEGGERSSGDNTSGSYGSNGSYGSDGGDDEEDTCEV